MIVVLDLGLANVGSVARMLKRVNADVKVACDEDSILAADALVIPGVGSFDAAMTRLQNSEGYAALNQAVLERRKPVLGICLGMQLMTRSSEEGQLPGLGWIDAETVKFSSSRCLVPNMGWRYVTPREPNPLFSNTGRHEKFYFVHSYYVRCSNETDVLTTTDYGDGFVSSFAHENICGVQFHPEKSHMYGMTFFLRWVKHIKESNW